MNYLIFLTLLIHFVGAGLATRFEPASSRPKVSLMGEYPYNIALLISVAALILAHNTEYDGLVTILVLLFTSVFYAVVLFRMWIGKRT